MMEKTNTTWKERASEKILRTVPHDERISAVNNQGMAYCGMAAFAYVVIRLLYCGIKGAFALPEFVLLMLMAYILLHNARKNGICNLPVIMGKTLNPDKKAVWSRMGLYALDAAIFAACFALIMLLQDHSVAGFLLSFFMGFFMDFVFQMAVKEPVVRKYRKQQEMLDAEENDMT